MYLLHVDNPSDFKCNVQVEGAKISDTKVRLVIENTNLNLLFNGTIAENGDCIVPISNLKNILKNGSQGKIKLEIIADDTFFSPWEDNYSAKVDKRVTVEVNSSEKEKIVEDKLNVQILSIDTPINHAKKLSEILKKRGINKRDVVSHKKKVNIIIETYIKKYKIKQSSGQLLSNMLKELK